MDHAPARHVDALQVHRQFVMGTSGVEDHRQIVALCQPELRVQNRLLAFKLRIFTIEIEADLTDGNQLHIRVLQRGIQPVEMVIKMVLNNDRMQTQRGIQRIVPPGKRQNFVESRRFNSGHNNGSHTGLSRTRKTGCFLPAKRREIKVAMGIDKAVRHARSSLSSKPSLACGASTSGIATASLATTAGGKMMLLCR